MPADLFADLDAPRQWRLLKAAAEGDDYGLLTDWARSPKAALSLWPRIEQAWARHAYHRDQALFRGAAQNPAAVLWLLGTEPDERRMQRAIERAVLGELAERLDAAALPPRKLAHLFLSGAHLNSERVGRVATSDESLYALRERSKTDPLRLAEIDAYLADGAAGILESACVLLDHLPASHRMARLLRSARRLTTVPVTPYDLR